MELILFFLSCSFCFRTEEGEEEIEEDDEDGEDEHIV
jgi:hypothetical protein